MATVDEIEGVRSDIDGDTSKRSCKEMRRCALVLDVVQLGYDQKGTNKPLSPHVPLQSS